MKKIQVRDRYPKVPEAFLTGAIFSVCAPPQPSPEELVNFILRDNEDAGEPVDAYTRLHLDGICPIGRMRIAFPVPQSEKWIAFEFDNSQWGMLSYPTILWHAHNFMHEHIKPDLTEEKFFHGFVLAEDEEIEQGPVIPTYIPDLRS